MWDALLAWLVEEGAADDLTDPAGAIRWSKRHQEHVFEVVQRFLDKWTKEEFAVAAQSRKLPWSAVDRPDELLVNPQLNDRDFFVDVVSPDGVTRDLGFGFAFPQGRAPGISWWRSRVSTRPCSTTVGYQKMLRPRIIRAHCRSMASECST